MNLNKKKKAMYKSALAVLLSGTMMAGCSKNEEPTQDPNPGVTDSEETKEPEKKDDSLPTEVMTAEETSALTAGQFVSAEDLLKLPDALALENMDLTFIYVYNYLPGEEGATYKSGLPILEEIAYQEEVLGMTPNLSADDYKFDGIEIVPIYDYVLDIDSVWKKSAQVGPDWYVLTGPVLSEEKLQELEGNQKVLQ